ncbi:ran-binding protein 10 isoform X2 [Nasonia vitripennis]|uniref:Uncharacterized protein n=1 Tax=Nasonia vitripennis TaxID=7425 RepID=A0A7M7R2K1_NASVI|nr:ran-binding protein 10 isoform X2 [Nasonia vitripennis]
MAESNECEIIETTQSNFVQNQSVDRLKLLYPMVNEEETPLPRSWSPKDKYNYIGLSQNNLRVHYKGYGKTHKDAASVRTTHSIPAACGLYYFEVKIVSKGRDGYMGIGLSAHGVNVNRLPGWDKNSYGYHGDDGHSFCSSGTGQPYGPTFTTGDVIGCGVNLVDNTAFYTKNGHHLGIAFTDLPPNLYPTVGLQTPGEVVDANFGQAPFVFDISDMISELRIRTRLQIVNFPAPDYEQGKWQDILHKMVSTYLVHHGYCATAESFAHSTGQIFQEDLHSIKNRQKILRLILAGHMGEAIDLTIKMYPGLLESDSNLMFALKCRQFVEMVNGTDSEINRSNTDNQTSVIQSTKFVVKSSANSNFTELNHHNALNKSSDKYLIHQQIEDDVEMEDNTVKDITNAKNCIAFQKTGTNGFKCSNKDETQMDMDQVLKNIVTSIVFVLDHVTICFDPAGKLPMVMKLLNSYGPNNTVTFEIIPRGPHHDSARLTIKYRTRTSAKGLRSDYKTSRTEDRLTVEQRVEAPTDSDSSDTDDEHSSSDSSTTDGTDGTDNTRDTPESDANDENDEVILNST